MGRRDTTLASAGPSSRVLVDRTSTPDEEIIMLGLYEWLHETVLEDNTARNESSEG